MPYLKFHPETEPAPAADAYQFPSERFGGGGRLFSETLPRLGDDMIAEVERAMELVDKRLHNLRALVNQFGLEDDDDGPRAA